MNSLYTFGYVMYACKNENQIDLVKNEFCFFKIHLGHTHERASEWWFWLSQCIILNMTIFIISYFIVALLNYF